MFYFLSYRVLLIPKTSQSPKKTSRITTLERNAQIPIGHFSCQRDAKRGPPGAREDFFRQFRFDPLGPEFLPEPRLPHFHPPSNVVFRESPVIQKSFGQQLCNHRFGNLAKLRGELFSNAIDAVIASAEEFDGVVEDLVHDAILRPVRRLLILSILLLPSCGYRLAGKQWNSGRGLTIAVPSFGNRTTGYRIEQRLTDAVRLELIRRTRFSVQPADAGDLLLAGEVQTITLSPIIFNQQGRGSSYSIIVDMKVSLTDRRTGTIVFQNDHWTFREVFELAQNSAEFVPEDTVAMDRLGRRFAASLVATILHAKP